ncbi:MAG: hypothetical protein OXF01_08320 [Gemmatimonadetes bacterium]|nr:hypothetical protein [Gemmatimonadota bacterium]
MNDSSSGKNRFEGWEDAAADAVAFAEQFPPEVRSGIVLALLMSSESRGTAASTKGPVLGAGGTPSPKAPGGIAAVAQDAGVDANTLGRFIQIAEGGTVTVRAARLGTSYADSQNVYSTLLAYVREKALGELDTESALIRAICNVHRCIDRNLAANLRNRAWLLEHGVKGGNKSYRLSPEGEQAAREQIVSLCGGSD